MRYFIIRNHIKYDDFKLSPHITRSRTLDDILSKQHINHKYGQKKRIHIYTIFKSLTQILFVQ